MRGSWRRSRRLLASIQISSRAPSGQLPSDWSDDAVASSDAAVRVIFSLIIHLPSWLSGIFLLLGLRLLGQGRDNALVVSTLRRAEVLGCVSWLENFLLKSVHALKHLLVVVCRESVPLVHSLGQGLETVSHVCIEAVQRCLVITELFFDFILPEAQVLFKCVDIVVESEHLRVEFFDQAL